VWPVENLVCSLKSFLFICGLHVILHLAFGLLFLCVFMYHLPFFRSLCVHSSVTDRLPCLLISIFMHIMRYCATDSTTLVTEFALCQDLQLWNYMPSDLRQPTILVVQLIQTVAEDVFIWASEPQCNVNCVYLHFIKAPLLPYMLYSISVAWQSSGCRASDW